MVLMTLGAVILFDVVATLGGGADTTLAVGATTLGNGGSSGASHCPVMMAVRFWIAKICLLFSIILVDTVFPSTLRMSAAATMERSCCEVTGIWQWVGYRRHVLENRKCRMDGM
jgi:hypothetical protein